MSQADLVGTRELLCVFARVCCRESASAKLFAWTSLAGLLPVKKEPQKASFDGQTLPDVRVCFGVVGEPRAQQTCSRTASGKSLKPSCRHRAMEVRRAVSLRILRPLKALHGTTCMFSTSLDYNPQTADEMLACTKCRSVTNFSTGGAGWRVSILWGKGNPNQTRSRFPARVVLVLD